MYIYIYIYISVLSNKHDICSDPMSADPSCPFPISSRQTPVLMYGSYYNFKNIRFNKSQHINDLSAAHVDIHYISREMLTCRLLK